MRLFSKKAAEGKMAEEKKEDLAGLSDYLYKAVSG